MVMKTQINITVETKILEDFNKLGLNRSQICEDALRRETLNQLGIEEEEIDMPKCFMCNQDLRSDSRTYKGLGICRECWLSANPKELIKKSKEILGDKDVLEKKQKQ